MLSFKTWGRIPGDPVFTTSSFQCKGHRFNPWLGKFHMPWDAVKKIPKGFETWGQGDSFTGKSVKGQTIRELRSPSYEESIVQEPMWFPSLGREG